MSTTHAFRTAETLRLPSELSGAIPRDVRLTGGGIAVTLVALAMAIGALASAILMSVAYVHAEERRQLRERESIAIEAEVAQVALRRGEHPRRVVTYRYDVDGRRYTGRTVLRQSDRRAVVEGGLIPVAYVQSHPETNWTIGYEADGFPLWVIPLTSVSLLLAAAAITWRVRRQWILLSEGRVARARVTAYKKVRKENHRVSYEFQALSGATRTARCDVGKKPPPLGTMIPVVYHRDQPEWSAAYPFPFVRPSRSSWTSKASADRSRP
jgi:hypothetical protein